MKIIVSFLSIILGLLLVIGLHEFGHACAAFIFGVKVKRVSIGFGPPILLWKDKRGVDWVIALLPLGGFVQLQNSRIDGVNAASSFDKKPVWVRLIILVSGVLMNILVSISALTSMFYMGYEQGAPIINEVLPKSIAFDAGFKSQQEILSINGQKVDSWRMVNQYILMNIGEHVLSVMVKGRDGTSLKMLDLKHWQAPKSQTSLLTSVGIQPDESKLHRYFIKGVAFTQSLKAALYEIANTFYFFVMMLQQILTGNIPFILLLGPLGIFSVMIDSFLQGLTVFLYFIAHLSLAVATVNLFPIPGLDGASILYAIIEKMAGKPISIRLEILLYRLALIGFSLFLLQLLLNDLFHIWLNQSM